MQILIAAGKYKCRIEGDIAILLEGDNEIGNPVKVKLPQ